MPLAHVGTKNARNISEAFSSKPPDKAPWRSEQRPRFKEFARRWRQLVLAGFWRFGGYTAQGTLDQQRSHGNLRAGSELNPIPSEARDNSAPTWSRNSACNAWDVDNQPRLPARCSNFTHIPRTALLPTFVKPRPCDNAAPAWSKNCACNAGDVK